MQVLLRKQIPSADGYYLVKFGIEERPHLVEVRTREDGMRDVVCDNHKNLFFNNFPDIAYWSEKIRFNFEGETPLTEAEQLQEAARGFKIQQCKDFVAKIHEGLDIES
jgi:hypothetical protein